MPTDPYDFTSSESQPPDPVPVGVVCGICGGGPIYFERCMDSNPTTHEWATAGECQQCGERTEHVCPECGGTSELGGSPDAD